MQQMQTPDWLGRELANMTRGALDRLSKELADPAEVQLLQLIQHTERRLVWDPGSAEVC